MLQAIHRVLADEPRVAYGLVFGSRARGTAHAGSDVDIAIGTSERLDPLAIGDLVGRLEEATRLTVDLVQLEFAPPALAYRVFRDGVVVLERDRPALVQRKARAILEYLDFKPFEDILTRGALEGARRHGR